VDGGVVEGLEGKVCCYMGVWRNDVVEGDPVNY